MELKTSLVSLTAASVLAFSTAFAQEADDIKKPAEPQDQSAISVGPDLNPPAEARTRELPPEDLGVDEEQTAGIDDTEQNAGVDMNEDEADQAALEEDREETIARDENAYLEDEEPQASGAGTTAGSGMEQQDQQMGQQQQAQMQIPAPVTDEMISNLQAALKQRGYDVRTDGIWGPNTHQALTEFQNEQGIQGDGQINTETLAALELDQQGQPTGQQQAQTDQQQSQQDQQQAQANQQQSQQDQQQAQADQQQGQQAAGGGTAGGQQQATAGGSAGGQGDLSVEQEIDQAQRDLEQAEEELGTEQQ